MPDKKFEIGKMILMEANDVPTEFREVISEVMQNLHAIHGMEVVQYMAFTANLKSLLSLFMMNANFESLEEAKKIGQAASTLASALSTAFAAALNLDEDKVDAAHKTVDTLDGVVEQMTKSLRKKKPKT